MKIDKYLFEISDKLLFETMKVFLESDRYSLARQGKEQGLPYVLKKY